MPELFQSKTRIRKQNRNKGTKGKETVYNENITMEMKPKEKVILENKKQKILRNIQMGGFRGKALHFRKPPTLEYRIRKRIKRFEETPEDQDLNNDQLPIPTDFQPESYEQFALNFFGQPTNESLATTVSHN